MDFLDKLREATVSRVPRWHNTPQKLWTILEWAGAMCGEAGEAANVAKKIRRLEQGLNTKDYDRQDLIDKLAEECADTIIYMDCICAHAGIDLKAAIIKKYNETSDFYGFPEKL